MKKITISLLIVFCLLIAVVAHAGHSTLGDAETVKSTIFGGGTYKPSTGVTLDITTDSLGAYYCASSQHKSALASNNGLQYATLSSSPAMPSIVATSAGKPTSCQSESALPSGFPTN